MSSVLVLLVVAVLLFSYFRTPVFAAQVLCEIPLALIGGVLLTKQLVDNISVATLVGFIAVAGIAARNSIMLVSHYLNLMRSEGFSREMIERGTLERLVPDAGLAFVFKGYDGKDYLFANKRMPIPKHRKTHEIQGGETIVAFENGNIFSAIQFIVRGLAADFGMKKRIDLACAAITAIANLDQQGATRMAA